MSDCPICFERFATSVIATHASNCTGKKASSSSSLKRTSPETHSFFSKRAKVDSSESEVPKKEQNEVSKSPHNKKIVAQVPLAEEMRPSDLKDYVGQLVAVSDQSFFKLPPSKLPSMILWGPPGCGKTTLANIIATNCKRDNTRFVKMSACTSGVQDLKEVIGKSKNELAMFKRKTVLFMDEVHRFNKLQQDAFLPHVENGTVTLIGATTENPSFSLNSALLSRCRVVALDKLSSQDILVILNRALVAKQVTTVSESILQCEEKCIETKALEYLANVADGDARTALNCLEIALNCNNKIEQKDIKESLKRSHMIYDRKGDEHYHCASALQKSIRGSDDNAALYWTMRMYESGEDPLFIARRLVRTAAEDVGLGDPSALNLAVSTMQGCQLLGRPESNVLLAQCAVYLARAKKNAQVYKAMNRVVETFKAEQGQMPPVPLHLRNASNKLAKDLGYGQGYSHDPAVINSLNYMPEGMEKVNFF